MTHLLSKPHRSYVPGTSQQSVRADEEAPEREQSESLRTNPVAQDSTLFESSE